MVQTLHNFRLLCPNALLFRDGRVCEDCLGRSIPWPAVVHKCYRGSRSATAAVAAMLMVHRAMGTWWEAVDVYIALAEFCRRKFIEGGLPAEKIVVKPNFIATDPGVGGGRGGYGVFVGRLAPEKGLETLLKAWKILGGKVPLKVVGDGPMTATVEGSEAKDAGIEWLGHRSAQEVYSLIGEAMFLVFPSEWYENLPRVIIEAFAKGTPVIASRLVRWPSWWTTVVPGCTSSRETPTIWRRRSSDCWPTRGSWSGCARPLAENTSGDIPPSPITAP